MAFTRYEEIHYPMVVIFSTQWVSFGFVIKRDGNASTSSENNDVDNIMDCSNVIIFCKIECISTVYHDAIV